LVERPPSLLFLQQPPPQTRSCLSTTFFFRILVIGPLLKRAWKAFLRPFSTTACPFLVASQHVFFFRGYKIAKPPPSCSQDHLPQVSFPHPNHRSFIFDASFLSPLLGTPSECPSVLVSAFRRIVFNELPSPFFF